MLFLSARGAIRRLISHLAFIAIPAIVVEYQERHFVVEVGARGLVELRGHIGSICEVLPLARVGPFSLTGARATPASGVAFNLEPLTLLLAPDLKYSVDLAKFK